MTLTVALAVFLLPSVSTQARPEGSKEGGLKSSCVAEVPSFTWTRRAEVTLGNNDSARNRRPVKDEEDESVEDQINCEGCVPTLHEKMSS